MRESWQHIELKLWKISSIVRSLRIASEEVFTKEKEKSHPRMAQPFTRRKLFQSSYFIHYTVGKYSATDTSWNVLSGDIMAQLLISHTLPIKPVRLFLEKFHGFSIDSMRDQIYFVECFSELRKYMVDQYN